MTKFLLLFVISVFGVSCSTTEFHSYKKGEAIAFREELVREPISKELKVTLSDINSKEFQIDLVNVSTSHDSWVDKYQEIAVYKKRCNGFLTIIVDKEDKNAKCIFFINYIPDNYVLKNYIGDSFGFVEEKTTGVFLENKSEIVKEEEKLSLYSLSIEIDGKKIVVSPTNNTYSITYSQLNTDPFKAFSKSIFLILNNENKLNITEAYRDLIKRNVYEKEEKARNERSLPSSIAKRHYVRICGQDSLERLLQVNRSLESIEKGCLYKLYSENKYPFLKVSQTTNEGILASFLYDPYGDSPFYFIKTKKSFVDDQPIRNMYFKYIGPISYTTVLGGMKTVHGFQFLEDVE